MNQYELAAVTGIVEALDQPVTVSSARISSITAAGYGRVTKVVFAHNNKRVAVLIAVDTDGTIYHWPEHDELTLLAYTVEDMAEHIRALIL